MRLRALVLLLALLALPLQSATNLRGDFRLVAEVDKEISSKSAKVGDNVTFLCVQKVTAQDGTVLIPMGARLLAKVVAVQKYRNEQPARLSLRAETAKWSGGEAKLDAIVVTIVFVAKAITTLGPGSPPMSVPEADEKTDVSNKNYNTRSPTGGTIRVREPSEGEQHASDLSPPPSRVSETVPAAVPDSWGLEKVDDPTIGSAITVDDGDVVLTKGTRLIFKTR